MHADDSNSGARVPSIRTARRDRVVSFVLPVYNESAGIQQFHDALSLTVSGRPDLSVEFIYVNDGSTDESLALLRYVARSDSRVRVLDFSRNFGHQMAITAGMDVAHGDAVIVMDTDLQDPPEVALELISAWEDGAQVAYAQRRTRQDSVIKRMSAYAYYRMLDKFSDVDIPRDAGDFRLLDRTVVDELVKCREANRYVRGMVAALGFEQVAVPFDRHARATGETGYPLWRMLKLAADGITSSSTLPLRLISRAGYLTMGLAVVGIVYAVLMRIFAPEVTVPGWTLLMIVVLMLGGVQLLTLGVIGGYVGRIYTQVQNRPLYIVREEVGLGEATAEVRELSDRSGASDHAASAGSRTGER